MKENIEQSRLFSEQELDNIDGNLFADREQSGPVTCLGMEFENDEARREYFRAELRKKLPELRHIEGFPIGEDDDIIALSDPPYYTACPNPWLNDFIAQWEAEKADLEARGLRTSDFEVKEPYATDISVGKNNPIYNAHSYHTKVPHPAIIKLIEHYTQPGDIIYDGFAGTGMTGVAAGLCAENKGKLYSRHAVCNDLSPIATFIAYNLNINTSPQFREFDRILKEVKDKWGYLYRTKHSSGFGTINYIVWSDIIVCDHCNNEIPFWDLFIQYGQGNILDEAHCPHCHSIIKRSKCQKKMESYFDKYINDSATRAEMVPVLISYFYGGKKFIKKPDEFDLQLIEEVSKLNNESWVPTNILGEGDKMGDPAAKGIQRIHQFYFDRTLFVLSKIWERCSLFNWFNITNSISRNLTKTNRFIVNKYNPNGRINGPLTGTLYVPSEIVEQNVFEILEYQKSDIDKINLSNAIQVGDALHVPNIEDESIDYVFTDPPFGANIMYSELNVISESWLKVTTNNEDEAIENKHQQKDTIAYQSLMTGAFKEYYRILKPNRWMTVEFSNTSAKIWNAIQYAITNAGFIIVSVVGFDKVHGGLKSMRYTTAVKEDLIITCFKPSSELVDKFRKSTDYAPIVWDLVGELLEHLPVHIVKEQKTTTIVERSPKILFDRLIAYYVQHGYPVPLNAQDFQKGLRDRFIELDGMFFTAPQAAEYQEKKRDAPEMLPMGLIVSDEANGIEWLKLELKTPQTYQEIQPKWLQAVGAVRKNDIIPELRQLLEENFIEEANGKWRLPNIQDDKDVAALRTKALMREFKLYVEQASKPKGKIKEARVEALRAGFKQCYIDKDFKTIVMVGDRIPANLRDEDEVLLQFYDIALNKI